MSPNWPPLDTHAHVKPTISQADLLGLRAVVFAATRRLDEFKATRERDDPVTVWGVGVHPGVQDSIEEFNAETFRQLIRSTPLVSEVGLDRASRVPLPRQQEVFSRVLETLSTEPRIASIHSTGVTKEVLDILERHGTRGVILHWWRGTAAETARAVKLGCYFSINASELTEPLVLQRVPPGRLLTETDHPYGNRMSANARPGVTAEVEAAIARIYPGAEVRPGLWGNLRRLVHVTATEQLFPRRIQGMLRAAPDPLGT